MKNLLLHIVLTLCLLFSLSAAQSRACTSVIVSGKVTKDGRPIIFKNRDTPNTDNVSRLIQGARYRYIAIVAADDKDASQVWGGHNEAGFAIINTAAYNLNGCEGKDSNRDGHLMKQALEICKSLKDFENLLDTLPRPMDLNSNFGVMDAEGGCAYYETSNTGYVKFDANDPTVAPHGYLMRTNHGMTGCRSIDIGVERYLAISDIMAEEEQKGKIDAARLLTIIPRYLTHGLTKINLYDLMPAQMEDTRMFPFGDFIPRWNTSSAILVQGIKPGEPATATVSWTNIGWPLASVAIPLVITPSGTLPEVVQPGQDGSAWMCRMAMKQKMKVFNLKSGKTHDYIDISKLINRSGTGIAQQVEKIEKEVLKKGNTFVEKVRKGKNADRLASDYYTWTDTYLKDVYPKE